MAFGSAKHTQGVLGLQTYRKWALGFRRKHRGFCGTRGPIGGGFVIPNTPIGFGGIQGPSGGGFVTPNTPIVFGGTQGPLAGNL
ncbi:Hypothetical protein FKW44_005547 [Caligus rogercresseyi]|uniref:Uncharacterized protein n=1 Tax=Caligus rogercresseyi TaxID=217165 RepID=A0A7T8KC59_CALRO|nr:Hypothetical protein FKW44_005547 [Caligus rogercresseyi]